MNHFNAILNVALIGCALSATAADYYVSTTGSDSAPGTFVQPFKTLGHALQNVVGAGDTVYMRGGRYHEEISGANLHGTDGNPITITRYQNEQVTLDGSESLADLGGASWSVYSGSIYTTTISKDIWQLWVDGRMGIAARWPNANTHPCDPIEPQLKADGYTPKDGSWWDLDGTWGHIPVYPADGNMQNNPVYQTVPNVSFAGGSVILNYHSESTFTRPITNHVAGSNLIEHVPVFNPHDQKSDGRFLVEAMSALDQAGEWYYDKDTGEVRLWCEDGQPPQGRDIRGKTVSCALDFDSVDYVNMVGIDFFGCTINFPKVGHTTLEDCTFDYPSFYPRMLGIHSYSGEAAGEAAAQPPQYGATYFDGGNGAQNVVRNCIFRYSDGSVNADGNVGTVFENCLFTHFSFVGMAQMVMMANGGVDAITDRCTFLVNGSKVMQKHSYMDIHMSRAAYFGYLQQDGCAWQCKGGDGVGGPADGLVRSYLWHHQALKTGTRWDGDDGINGSDHHQVSMRVPASHNTKGDYHKVISNVSVALHDPTEPGMKLKDPAPILDPKNQNSDVYNNLASGISSDSDLYIPLTGNNGNNWNGFVDSTGPLDLAKNRLRDPVNMDFRPSPGSEIIDAGVIYAPITDGYLGAAPDIGAYEYGDTHYWIPGFQYPQACTPVPPNGTVNARPDCDLMWLAGKEAVSHDIYFGTDPENLVYQGNQSLLNNIFDPGTNDLTVGQTYYWRIDSITPTETITGDEWSFIVGADFDITYTDILATEDTYVANSTPDANYGGNESFPLITHEDGTETEAYFKFDVNVPDNIIGAELHLYSTASVRSGNVLIHAMDDTSWDEMTVTWNTKPGYGDLLVGPLDVVAGVYKAFDVFSYVNSTGIVSLAADRILNTSIRSVTSREHEFPPFLRLYHVDGDPDLPPDAPENLTTSNAVGQVFLDWDDNTEPDLAGYQVLRREHDEDNYTAVHPGLLSASSYADTAGTPGWAYQYVVKAQDATGQWSYKSNMEYGTKLGDGSNHAPEFTSDPIVKTEAMAGGAYSDSIATDASDVDGDTLTFSLLSAPSWLSVATNGLLSGIPDAAYAGLNTFSVEVSDGNGGIDTADLHITVEVPPPPTGQQLAYEGFEYLAGNKIHGLNGGFGFSSAWVSTQAGIADENFEIVSAGDTWGDLPVSSNRLSRVGTGGTESISRMLTADLDETNLWFSVLWRPSSNEGFAIGSGALLEDGSVPDYIDGDVGFGFMNTDNASARASIWSASGRTDSSGVIAISQDAPILLAGYIEFNAGTSGEDRITLYPVTTNLTLGTSISLELDVDETTLNTLTMETNRGPGYDEIRLGRSFEDVVSDETTPPTVPPYEAWSAEYGLTGSDTNFNAHTDTDGMNQLVEYGLGGNPTNDDAAAILPVFGKSADESFQGLEYIYRRRTDAAARGLAYRLELNTNLVSNGWNANGYSEVGTAPLETGFEAVTNQISTESETNQFIRLRISID
ncbi:CBM96 family carbohydrate-binding protein [Pontiella sulfatireligans]|uniref:Carbohydrate-binding module family 96 domain-containing protein n=1 Tax=Pontiella sulfatireligans TaxID=2750658 RepID=A0A6C2UKC6_9BACT|nr:DNRLRE domain-containing protein [Pontiella sulfatireligans]VGO19646.1 hypothetical protein SCARR_01705 [Pontiella sulfatireligans]